MKHQRVTLISDEQLGVVTQRSEWQWLFMGSTIIDCRSALSFIIGKVNSIFRDTFVIDINRLTSVMHLIYIV
jgi:hypothetical protein